jgi:membrane-bound lytic murein transglycosylase C
VEGFMEILKKVLSISLISLSMYSVAYSENPKSFRDYYLSQTKEFNSFNKNEKESFNQYVKELNKEFEKYKKIYQEEFQKYKREIAAVWGVAEVPTRKRWVDYSQDLKTKKSIDYEKGEIEISVIAPSKKEAEKRIKRELTKLVLEDKETAFKNNKLLQRVEKRISTLKYVKKSKVDKEPLVSDLLFKKKPSLKEAKRFSEKVVRTSNLSVSKSKIKNNKVYTVKIKFPYKNLLRKALRYRPHVHKFASKYHLEPALVFAIIHTESSFNPFAQSPVPAYGLMQIVPQTAGKDATRIIYGKPVLLAPSYLYNGEKNILVGTTYLYLLYHHYFKNVKDPRSRLYCTIAAYNTGVGNVARAITGTTNLKKAVRKINTLPHTQVYDILIKNVPLETKNYLRRVLRRKKVYSRL